MREGHLARRRRSSSKRKKTTRSSSRRYKGLKRLLWIFIVPVIFLVGVPVGAKLLVIYDSHNRIYTHVKDVPKNRVAVILGAHVSPSGKLCDVLQCRVDKGIELYKAGKVQKLLMSGDNSVKHYNEPQRMLEYAVKHGVPQKDIAVDFAGRRTYDSMYRAKHIFGLNELIVVSQSYHLDRAIYLCNRLGIQGYGVAATNPTGQTRVQLRELPASVEAVFDALIQRPAPIMGKKEKI